MKLDNHLRKINKLIAKPEYKIYPSCFSAFIVKLLNADNISFFKRGGFFA